MKRQRSSGIFLGSIWGLALFGSLATAQIGQGMIASAWFTGWNALYSKSHQFTLDNVTWNRYTSLTYAFAPTSSNSSEGITLPAEEQQLLGDFVKQAHANNVTALLAVGGYSGSQYFSGLVANDTSRTNFATALNQTLRVYDLDGFDFDWEYPNHPLLSCSQSSSNDTANFLTFLQQLRGIVGTNITLSAAVSVNPFMDETQQPLTNVSDFAKVLDHIEIMYYDTFGPWSTYTGPNAPLDDSCAPKFSQLGSATSAVAKWTSAGMPKEKIVLAVPAYARSFTVDNQYALFNGSGPNATMELNINAPVHKGEYQPGDSWDTTEGEKDACGNAQHPSGTFNFWGLVENKWLVKNESPFFGNYVPAEGIIAATDNCSKTTFMYNKNSSLLVSGITQYDAAQASLFINSSGLKGFAMYPLGGDFNNTLVDAYRNPLIALY